MADGIVIDLTRERLARHPVEYAVILRHDADGFSVQVLDVPDTEHNRLAVARDLAAAAQCLSDAYEPTNGVDKPENGG